MPKTLLCLLALAGCATADQVEIVDTDPSAVDSDTDVEAPLAPDQDLDGYRADIDCNDTNPLVHPGVVEACNLTDDDCDGFTDEEGEPFDGATGPLYADGDVDGFGADGTGRWYCAAPAGRVAADGDCDDADPSIRPGGSEICDGVDDDCDGLVDGADPNVAAQGSPGAVQRHPDDDHDGYGAPATRWACSATEPGFVASGDDCDDTVVTIHPGAVEHCDGVDEDCDATVDEDGVDPHTWYADTDRDGHGAVASGTQVACRAPAGFVADDDDCDDSKVTVHPGATESCSLSTVDADCDGVRAGDDPDQDGSPECRDCAEGDAAVHPGAAEVWYDGTDQDCDGRSDFDADRDGYDLAGGTSAQVDCDDTTAAIRPGAKEIPDDGIDQDCSGADLTCTGQLGELDVCPATSCKAVLDADPASPDGVYWLGTRQAPYRAGCLMTRDGGGWTLAAIQSDDGDVTWTWDNRYYWTDSWSTTFGDPADPLHDHRSRALVELPFRDVLFVHAPSDVWAAYHGIDTGARSFGAFVRSYGTSGRCWGSTSGFLMSAGTITVTSALCSTRLFVSPQDQDGDYDCACTTCDQHAFGPAWSVDNGDGCPLDDPGLSGTLGPNAEWNTQERQPLGFGTALGLNTYASYDDGRDHMAVYVR